MSLLFNWLFTNGPEPAAACSVDVLGTAGTRNAVPRVIPTNAQPYEKSYGEWAAAWNQWLFSLPAAGHPLIDQTGESCDAGQSGPVWFLAMPTPAAGPDVTRHCTVPSGKSLLIPVIASECSTLEGNGTNEEELRACVENKLGFFRACAELEAEIDGVPIQNVEDYMLTSPIHDVGPIPQDGGLLGLPPGETGQSIVGAAFLLLAPPSAGEHVIRMRVSVSQCFGEPASSQVTYIIDVTR